MLNLIFTLDPVTGNFTITTPTDQFTLNGVSNEPGDGSCQVQAEGSGKLGDPSPNAANIRIRIDDDGLVIVEDESEFASIEGTFRFNFMNLLNKSDSSVAVYDGSKTE